MCDNPSDCTQAEPCATCRSDVDPTAINIERDPRAQRMRGTAYHGGTPFDVPYVSHIEGNLWSGGCADGLILPETFIHVVSLYPWEAYAVAHEVRSYLVVRMYDSEEQGLEQVDAIAAWVRACADDAPTLVHCQAGLNRSGLVAARALMLAGHTAESAIRLMREKRSSAVLCNRAFERWLLELKPPIKKEASWTPVETI